MKVVDRPRVDRDWQVLIADRHQDSADVSLVHDDWHRRAIPRQSQQGAKGRRTVGEAHELQAVLIKCGVGPCDVAKPHQLLRRGRNHRHVDLFQLPAPHPSGGLILDAPMGSVMIDGRFWPVADILVPLTSA